jgi:RNA polymerase-interacting CarD/CdnL/TRCF family regulator
MSAPRSIETSQTTQSSEPQNRALTRLAELKRALQRQLKRKPTLYEKQLLDRAAAMMLRAEIAAFDGKADSNTIVRLDNAARRARQDFERICGVDLTPKAAKPKQHTMRDIERELSHAR